MATDTTKKRAIRYLNRDFESFKRDLIEHLRIYFPDTVQDFQESSQGMALTEMSAFIGDNLSFYLDKKFDESFIATAREKKNLFKHAKQNGWKPFGKSAACGVLDAYLKVPASSSLGKTIPDMRYAGIVRKSAKLKSNAGESYETLLDIDFSTVDQNNPAFIQVSETDVVTEEPLSYVLKKSEVDVKAGETTTATFSVGSYKSFRKITIQEDDVTEIQSVVDSEGNQWYEVDYLAQDTVFDGVPSTGDGADEVPYIMKLRSVPYRFISEYDIDTNRMSLIFGTGDAEVFDGELIPDLGDLSLPLYGKDTFTDFSLDPQNFLKTRTLGLAPVNTTLTVKYRAGGGAITNAGAGEVASVASSFFDIGDSTLSTSTARDVGNSFSVQNPKPIQGGRDELDIEELRHLISANFSAQSRMVTPEDFIARTLSMPPRFGSIFRATANAGAVNKNGVELVILSRDSNGYVTTAPQDLKENLKKYLSRFRMLTDAIEILDGDIINIAAHFDVLTIPDFVKSEVVANCLEVLKKHFTIAKVQINQPINLTTINTLLGSVPGVLSLIDFKVIGRVGNFDSRSYSSTSYNIKENTQNGIIYCKNNSIFEIKYLAKDISGTAK